MILTLGHGLEQELDALPRIEAADEQQVDPAGLAQALERPETL